MLGLDFFNFDFLKTILGLPPAVVCSLLALIGLSWLMRRSAGALMGSGVAIVLALILPSLLQLWLVRQMALQVGAWVAGSVALVRESITAVVDR